MNIFDKVLGYLALAPILVPLVKEAVIAVESKGGGTDKTQAVLDIVTAAIQGLLPQDNKIVANINQILGFAKTLIAIYVGLFNKNGVFEQGAK